MTVAIPTKYFGFGFGFYQKRQLAIDSVFPMKLTGQVIILIMKEMVELTRFSFL